MDKDKFKIILEAAEDHRYAKVKHLYANFNNETRRAFLMDFLDESNQIHARVKYILLNH